ncbi:MAG TPA: lipoyl synthase [Fibrobacteraceae bacterium]|nr:lipoyl synthase [Fibrobacteraceae bacterium]
MIPLRKPLWLKGSVGGGPAYRDLSRRIQAQGLHTVCDAAHCPNKGECWSRGVATLMILGDICTRSCSFCNVHSGRPLAPDLAEPERVANAVQGMGIRYLTLTSVDRDDLEDLGAEIWAETIRRSKTVVPSLRIEALTPDFQGRTELLDAVLEAGPDVLNHNLETVPRLQRTIRKAANWKHSTQILEHAHQRGFYTKTGIMVGLGETDEEVLQFLEEMAAARVDIVTIGQYLQPTARNTPVQRYVEPSVFQSYAEQAHRLGIPRCESAPLVRSSWHAEDTSAGLK